MEPWNCVEPRCPRHHRDPSRNHSQQGARCRHHYIDTSIDYGLSEERIGRYISHRRAEYYLASKCGCLVGAPPMPRGQRGQHVFTRDNVVAGVEQSLVRMKTDYLDVVQFHSSPSRQTLEEHGALDALLELKEVGKVRFIGMSGTLPHLTDHIAMGVFDVFQIPYSAVEREHESAIATAAQKGAGIVIRGGAAKGAPTEGKQAGLQWERWRRADVDDLLDDMTPMEFILRFTFTNPDLDTTIVGTINRRTCRPTSTSWSKGRYRRTSTRRLSTASLLPARRHKRAGIDHGQPLGRDGRRRPAQAVPRRGGCAGYLEMAHS
jgi:aryl-alcohol dehydrogenase-like predicted oxidoreductase